MTKDLREGEMQVKRCGKLILSACVVAASFCLCAGIGNAQESSKQAPSSAPTSEAATEVTALAGLIRDLQGQVQVLNAQLNELRTEQQQSTEETRELRQELDTVRKMSATAANGAGNPSQVLGVTKSAAYPPTPLPSGIPQEVSTPERLTKLEENQELIEGKLNDVYQTKVESGSKYRLRLSGIVLLNLFEDRGLVDNLDFPAQAVPPDSDRFSVSSGSFGGSLRQSQIRLQAFGPDIAGAKTSADAEFDFSGGFSENPNGAVMGLVRMRTAKMRMDWANTSLVAGQDALFFVPLAPTSLATLATPEFSYTGNLWAWTPQVRAEHRLSLPGNSSLLLQGGILDNLTGDTTYDQYNRSTSWGEESGQPVFATRVAWSRPAFGETVMLGVGGYYGRQNWGLHRTLDGWAGTVDVSVPLGKQFEFTGAFYRGRGAGGFGGAIAQPVVVSGPFSDPKSVFRGLDSLGGWAQLKYKVSPKFEWNAAFGTDNAFAGELRRFNAFSIYDYNYTRNLSPMINFIYQIRSDILISTEYRWLHTDILDSGSNSAHHINLSVGYLF